MYGAQIQYEITEADIQLLAETMRDEEVAEVFASSGLTPFEALQKSVRRSDECFSIWRDGSLLLMSGIHRATVLGRTGCPWCLTANAVKKHPRILIYYTRVFTNKWLEDFDELVNMIDARYTQSLRWAKGCGFEVHEAEPFGPFGMPFHRITMRK